MQPVEVGPGRWWFDLFPVDQEPFETWVREHPDRIRVRTTATDAAGWGHDTTLAWVLFEVSDGDPLLWPLPGRPTKAGADVRGPTDVVQRPEPETDPLWSLPSPPAPGLVLGGALALLGLGWFLGRGRR